MRKPMFNALPAAKGKYPGADGQKVAGRKAETVSRRKNVRRKPLELRRCKQCDAEFSAVFKRAGFCSSTCASRFYYRRTLKSHKCAWCGSAFQSKQHSARYCSRACQGKGAGQRLAGWHAVNPHPQQKHASRADALRLYGFKRRAAHQAKAAVFSYEEIFERDGWLCQICTEEVDRSLVWPHPRSASLDHIMPIAQGGSHEPSNVQCAHLGCNSSKGAKLRWSGEHLGSVGTT